MTTEPDFDADLRVETTTIMFADVVESVRLIEQDELANVARIRQRLKRLCNLFVSAHCGEVIERRGDGLLVKFPCVANATACALRIHADNRQEKHERIEMRIGIHLARVLSDATAHYGRDMSLCARLTALARPGQTVLSSEARDQIVPGIDADIEDLGECFLKHVAEPVRAFRISELIQPTNSSAGVAPIDGTAEPIVRGPNAELRPVVALLRFQSALSADASSVTAASLLHDQLVNRLGRSASVSVISTLSTAGLDLSRHSEAQVVAALRADYVVIGELSVRDGRCVASYRVLRGRDCVAVLTDLTTAPVQDLLAEDSELVGGIAAHVGSAVLAHELRSASVMPLPNLASYTLLLTALSMLHRFARRDFAKVESLLSELRDRLPRSSLALAWLARWHVFRVVQGWSLDPTHDARVALSLSQRALDINGNCSVALTMRGSVARSLERDFDSAQRYFQSALTANPNEPLAWLFKGTVHGLRGEGGHATEATRYAMRLSPLDPMRFYYESLSATAATGSRRFADAIVLAKRALKANVTHASTYRTMAISQAMLGQMVEARETIERLLVIEPTATVSGFLDRVSERSSLNLEFASALAAAGLPLGRTGLS